MACHVLGQCHHRDVGAQGQRLVQVAAAPGVVQRQQNAAGPACSRQGGYVEQLIGQRGGAFSVHHAGVELESLGELCTVTLEVLHLDAEGFEEGACQPPGRAIYAVGHEYMVARPQVSQEHLGDGSQARRVQPRAMAAFQFGDEVFEGERRRIAPRTVAEHTLVFAAHTGFAHLRHVVEQHGTQARHGRVDAMGTLHRRATTGLQQAGATVFVQYQRGEIRDFGRGHLPDQSGFPRQVLASGVLVPGMAVMHEEQVIDALVIGQVRIIGDGGGTGLAPVWPPACLGAQCLGQLVGGQLRQGAVLGDQRDRA